MPQLDYTTYIALIPNVYISWLSTMITFYLVLPYISLYLGLEMHIKYQTFSFLYRFYGVLNHKDIDLPNDGPEATK